MNPSLLKFSLGVSLLIHGAVIGGVALFSQFHRPPVATLVGDVATLELIAAPPRSPEQVVAAFISPALPLPAAPVALPPTSAETVVPEMPVVLRLEENVLLPQPPPPAPAPIQGDGTSPTPGRDMTTVESKPTAKAKPVYLKNPEPVYPVAARRRHQEGLVLITARVSATGRATSLVLKQTSGFPLLDEAALNAVREWEFGPARIGSVAVESEIEVPVRFKLTD